MPGIITGIFVNDRGAYNSATEYNPLDSIYLEPNTYIAKTVHTNINPATDVAAGDGSIGTNWRIEAKGVSGGHLADITGPDATTGEITIEDSSSTEHDFNGGHRLKRNDNTFVNYRPNLKVKGLNVPITDLDSVTSQLDLTAIDGILDKTNLIAVSGQLVNLNSLRNELDAVEASLEHSDTGSVSQTFNIPAMDKYWKTADFPLKANMTISSSGVITRGASWTYGVEAEIYTPPILAWTSQSATVNMIPFTYVNVGFVFSKARHSAYIDIFKKLATYTGTDTSIPNPNSIYLENDSGARFTPYSEMSQASTDGVTIFKHTDPSPYTELYTMTVAIEAQFVSHYNSEARFTIQVDDHGIRGFHTHSGTDTLNTAKIKAALKANTEAINILRGILNRYPSLNDITEAPVGQFLGAVRATGPGEGTLAIGSFEIANVQQAGGTDSALVVITYDDSSPLDDFASIPIPITIAAGETATQVAARIVASFEGSSNATVVKFRDGYSKGGVAYGGYVMTSSGAVVTITSDNDGEIYNAALSIYEQEGRFGVINNRPIAHGSGGPINTVGFVNPPSGGVNWIDNTTAYEAKVWQSGDMMIPTSEFTLTGTLVPGTKAKMVVTATADPVVSRSRIVILPTNAVKMFPTPTLPVPAQSAGFGFLMGYDTGFDLPDTEAWGTSLGGSDSFIILPATGTADLARNTWLSNMETTINAITTNTAGAASGNDGASISTTPLMYRKGVASVVGDTVEIEALTNGSLGTIPEVSATGSVSYTYTDGTADTTPTQVYDADKLYRRNPDNNGWNLVDTVLTFVAVGDLA